MVQKGGYLGYGRSRERVSCGDSRSRFVDSWQGSFHFPIFYRLGRSRLVLLRLLESIARDIELQDDAVVHEPVDHRGRRHGVLEDLLPFRERQIACEHDTSSFVTLGQQREQDFHLFAILLHVADVVDDEGTELRETFQHSGETQLAFRQQQFLYKERARREQNAMPPMDELLADGTQQVSLPATGISERKNVLVAVDERALEQSVELYVHLPGQPLAVKRIPALFQR